MTQKVKYAATAIFALCIISVFFMSCSERISTQTYGKMCITVVDGMSDNWLNGATIVIPEADICVVTDKFGKTPILDIPIHNEISSEAQKAYREVTVICYSDGYTPYVLCFAHVPFDGTCSTPTVYMLNGGNEPFVVIENPSDEYINMIVNKYMPK